MVRHHALTVLAGRAMWVVGILTVASGFLALTFFFLLALVFVLLLLGLPLFANLFEFYVKQAG